MSLPTVTGTGYLISDGVEVKFSKGGTAYARLPLVFKNRRKGADGNWTHDKEVLVQGTVFGALAESLADYVDGRTDLNVTGELYVEEYEGKQQLKMTVLSAWPVKDSSKLAVAAVARKQDDDIPF